MGLFGSKKATFAQDPMSPKLNNKKLCKEYVSEDTEKMMASINILDDYSLEYVLSLLSFSDKIRLERVCKRWQELMFRLQTNLTINRNQVIVQNDCLNRLRRQYQGDKERKGLIGIHHKPLESVLRKCPNITRISLNTCFNSSVLSLIGLHCCRLRALSCDMIGFRRNDKNFIAFAKQYGHRLEEIQLQIRDDDHRTLAVQFLKFCPKVKVIRKFNHNVFISQDDQFLPNLEEVDGFVMMNGHLGLLQTFTDRYKQTMKKLDIKLFLLREGLIESIVDCISRLQNLEYLCLDFFGKIGQDSNRPVDQLLSKMFDQLNKLSKLYLSISSCFLVTESFFRVTTSLKNIKYLSVCIFGKMKLTGCLIHLRDCHRLQYLHICCKHSKLDKDFLSLQGIPEQSMEQSLTKLQFIRLTANYDPNDTQMERLSKLKSLEKIVVTNCDMKWGQNFYVEEFYFKKTLFRKILENPFDVNKLGTNCGSMLWWTK